MIWTELGVQATFHSSETLLWRDPNPFTNTPPPSPNPALTFPLSETNYDSGQDPDPPPFPLPECETPETGTDYSLCPLRQIRWTDRFCCEKGPALRKQLLKVEPWEPLSGSGGRPPAGAGAGGISVVAERPWISLHSAVGNQRL